MIKLHQTITTKTTDINKKNYSLNNAIYPEVKDRK